MARPGTRYPQEEDVTPDIVWVASLHSTALREPERP